MHTGLILTISAVLQFVALIFKEMVQKKRL